MEPTLTDALGDLGQLFLGGLFVVGGVRHFLQESALIPFMTTRGVPLPRLTLYAGSVLQILAGTLLVANLFTVAAASSLIVFTIVATVMFLPFWTLPSGVEREHSINGFLSNVGVIGGLLLAAGVGA